MHLVALDSFIFVKDEVRSDEGAKKKIGKNRTTKRQSYQAHGFPLCGHSYHGGLGETRNKLLFTESTRGHPRCPLEKLVEGGKVMEAKLKCDPRDGNICFDLELRLNRSIRRRLEPEESSRTSLSSGRKKIEPEETLIFFDEIQAAPKALSSLKYFYEHSPQYHVAAAGSLLGVKVGHASPFPVGKVKFLNLYPFNFFEYLDAIGKTALCDHLRKKNDFEPIPDPFHEELLHQLKLYMFIGGMPEPILRYIESQDLNVVREYQNNILESYLLDFSKYTSRTEAIRITHVWESIPAQLAKENKKFKYAEITKGARARAYELSIQWLKDAGLILVSNCISAVKLPLSGYKEDDKFKIFLLDVGLLGAMLKVSMKSIVQKNILFSQYNGAFTENFVAQQLYSEGERDLYYWAKPNIAEVDFVLSHDEEIYPLEVKAGKQRQKQSLKFYDGKYSPPVLSRATTRNFKHNGRICNYPLYGVLRFPELAKAILEKARKADTNSIEDEDNQDDT